ncbi:MAG: hypothetical protein JETT_0507 [Candidatus Jettenia ecosi]|uniref:Uncharacterized protein n=1 Tax=Candidatus Jettenia ecosi TaxID=2494326 RepID=A0A533QEK9_9BACT|nr:MAG: hypothetical protein JETT_0507 [Candidatus Jettenia ecosi]
MANPGHEAPNNPDASLHGRAEIYRMASPYVRFPMKQFS